MYQYFTYYKFSFKDVKLNPPIYVIYILKPSRLHYSLNIPVFQHEDLASVKRRGPKRFTNFKMIQFGTNVDLSDKKKWGAQVKSVF